jgi:hypothetical protein
VSISDRPVRCFTRAALAGGSAPPPLSSYAAPSRTRVREPHVTKSGPGGRAPRFIWTRRAAHSPCRRARVRR